MVFTLGWSKGVELKGVLFDTPFSGQAFQSIPFGCVLILSQHVLYEKYRCLRTFRKGLRRSYNMGKDTRSIWNAPACFRCGYVVVLSDASPSESLFFIIISYHLEHTPESYEKSTLCFHCFFRFSVLGFPFRLSYLCKCEKVSRICFAATKLMHKSEEKKNCN
jgi:hypothetical protein